VSSKHEEVMSSMLKCHLVYFTPYLPCKHVLLQFVTYTALAQSHTFESVLSCLQEKQQRSRARLSRVERGDGSQWLSSSRTKADLDALPGPAISSEDGAQTNPTEKSSVGESAPDSLMNEQGSVNSNLRSTRGQPRIFLPPADTDQISTNTGGKVKTVKAGGNHKKANKAALTLQPWAEGDGGRVPVWDSRSQRILWGNCAPLAKNIGKYLENHPTMKIWAGEGRQRFAVEEKVIERPILDSTSVEFQAREFLGSDDGEDSSNSIPPTPIRGAQTQDSPLHKYDDGAPLSTEEPDSDGRLESGVVKTLAEASTVVLCNDVAIQSASLTDLEEGIAGQVQDSSIIKTTDTLISGAVVPLVLVDISLADSQVTEPIPAESTCVVESWTTLSMDKDGVSEPQPSQPSLNLISAPLETLDTAGCSSTEYAQKTPPLLESVECANNRSPNLCVSASGADETLEVMVPESLESQIFVQGSASRSSDEEVQINDSAETVSQVHLFAQSNVGCTEGHVASTLQVPAEDTGSI
jgi:hypothetical protein